MEGKVKDHDRNSRSHGGAVGLMDDYWFNKKTCVVLEDDKERESLVLDQNGNPFRVIRAHKVGFDLNPRTRGCSRG